jgi:hypothetical protein
MSCNPRLHATPIQLFLFASCCSDNQMFCQEAHLSVMFKELLLKPKLSVNCEPPGSHACNCILSRPAASPGHHAVCILTPTPTLSVPSQAYAMLRLLLLLQTVSLLILWASCQHCCCYYYSQLHITYYLDNFTQAVARITPGPSDLL